MRSSYGKPICQSRCMQQQISDLSNHNTCSSSVCVRVTVVEEHQSSHPISCQHRTEAHPPLVDAIPGPLCSRRVDEEMASQYTGTYSSIPAAPLGAVDAVVRPRQTCHPLSNSLARSAAAEILELGCAKRCRVQVWDGGVIDVVSAMHNNDIDASILSSAWNGRPYNRSSSIKLN